MADGYVSRVAGASGCLVASSFADEFREDWLDPGYWKECAEPVASGGRGAAWFIHREAGDLVLRHFCRGGLPGRLLTRDYVFIGADSVRSFREFRLLNELYHRGLPVPEPVAAGYWRRSPLFYHASILVRRIPAAKPLSEFTGPDDLETWRAAGACIRRFHDAGVFHADLNCTNILVADQVYLIDFDRGQLKGGTEDAPWKAANLGRLKRSADKYLAALDSDLRDRLWQALLDGYHGR